MNLENITTYFRSGPLMNVISGALLCGSAERIRMTAMDLEQISSDGDYSVLAITVARSAADILAAVGSYYVTTSNYKEYLQMREILKENGWNKDVVYPVMTTVFHGVAKLAAEHARYDKEYRDLEKRENPT
jgi:hypothetical protein